MSFNSNLSVNVVTMGCSKNLVDSEVLISTLMMNNLIVNHESSDDADVVIVNTCGFIDSAKEESVDVILAYAKKKKMGDLQQLYVVGCLAQRYQDSLKEEIPEVDGFYGFTNISELITKLSDGKCDAYGKRTSITTPGHYAYLKIAEGCNRSCSFCAIPGIRGKQKSRNIEDILEEAELLTSKGVKELIVIAQDSTNYGVDMYGKKMLPELIEKLAQIDDVEWIRLQYAYPAAFPEELLSIIEGNKKICNYLDIPFQHISDGILKSMRRGLSSADSIDLIKKIRIEVPNLALRSTFIVGYPGESESDFEELLEFVKSTKFERLGAFTYSHEEGTHAYELQDNVSEEVKQQRFERLMELQSEISYEHNQKLIGESLRVVIDSKDEKYYYGRTVFDSPEVDNNVLILAEGKNIAIGDFVEVEIIDADSYDLYG